MMILRCVVLVVLSLFAVNVYGQEGVLSISSNVMIVPESASEEAQVQAYSVRIFSDNSQDARTKSSEIAEKFKEDYPNVGLDLVYDSPYFKITVGQYLTKEEAIMLWGALKDEYPTSFVVPIKVNMTNFASDSLSSLTTSLLVPDTLLMPLVDSVKINL